MSMLDVADAAASLDRSTGRRVDSFVTSREFSQRPHRVAPLGEDVKRVRHGETPCHAVRSCQRDETTGRA
jgi:hypothetical protein